MQRASPASSRCSGVQASSAGIGEPPFSLVAAPSRPTETAIRERSCAHRHRGNLHSRHGARAPRRHRLHGPARARRGAPRGTRAEARRPAARGAGGARRRRGGGARRRRPRRERPARRVPGCVGRRVAAPGRSSSSASAPVEAAVGAGAHYLDTTGEQAFVRLVHDRIEVRRPSCCPRSASTTCPATWPRGWPPSRSKGPLDEVVVAYSVKGVGTSRGTRRTIGARDGPEAGRLGGRPARGLALRRDDAHRALPVRRAHGRRMERHRAAHGPAAHRRSQRALLHPGAGGRGAGRPARPLDRAVRQARRRASARRARRRSRAARAASRSSPRRAAPAAKGAPSSPAATSTA